MHPNFEHKTAIQFHKYVPCCIYARMEWRNALRMRPPSLHKVKSTICHSFRNETPAHETNTLNLCVRDRINRESEENVSSARALEHHNSSSSIMEWGYMYKRCVCVCVAPQMRASFVANERITVIRT